jgi:UTP:GlnB (protein PII) uridylyltransferase
MSSQIHDPGVLSRYDDYEIRPDHLIQRVPNERRRYAMVSLVVNEVLDRSELVDISDEDGIFVVLLPSQQIAKDVE